MHYRVSISALFDRHGSCLRFPNDPRSCMASDRHPRFRTWQRSRHFHHLCSFIDGDRSRVASAIRMVPPVLVSAAQMMGASRLRIFATVLGSAGISDHHQLAASWHGQALFAFLSPRKWWWGLALALDMRSNSHAICLTMLVRSPASRRSVSLGSPSIRLILAPIEPFRASSPRT